MNSSSKTSLIGLALSAAALTFGCSVGPTVEMSGDDLTLPVGSGEPNLMVTATGELVLSWHEPADSGYALKFAVRQGSAWSDPVTIATGIPFLVNWADYPGMREMDDGTWAVHWLQRDRTEMLAYSIRMAISTDRGATWSESFSPHESETLTEHGFVSMVPFGGSLAVLWLDGRQTVEVDGVRGPMSLRFTTVDSRGVQGRDVMIDERICDCCNTAMTAVPGGLLVAYRDRSEAEVRDIGVRRIVDGEWSDVTHVGHDNWVYPGCPVNGPALDSQGSNVAIAWYTAPEQRARVNVAFSNDAGVTFGEPFRVDEGSTLGRVDIQYVGENLALVTYMENEDDSGLIRSRLVSPEGPGRPWTVAQTAPSRSSGFPEVARVGNELFYAWTLPGDSGGVRVTLANIRGVD